MPLGVHGSSLPAAALIPAATFAAAVGLVAVGGAQWLVLRRHVARAGLWIPANAAAWLLGLSVPFAAMSSSRREIRPHSSSRWVSARAWA